MEKILKAALIGTGNLSSKRIYPYLSTAGMKVQSVAAKHLINAQKKCDLYGGHPYDNWQEMVEREKPDVVIACVGPELHFEASKFCIKRNIPIYTEKPPATNANQIRELVNLAEKNNSLCLTGFKKRYSNCYQRARLWLSEYSVSTWECFSIDWYVGKFDLEQNPKETVILDFGIHAIDLITWLFGPTEKVVAFAKGWDSFAVNLKMINGMVGTLTFSDHRSFEFPGEETEITVAGGNAMSIHNSISWKIQKQGEPTEWFEPPTCLAGGDSGYNTGMLKELEVFADLVRQGENSLENLQTSYYTMLLYDAIMLSVNNDGKVVSLSQEIT